MASFRYKAFISYNHADEAWARWFHRHLERYRIPGKLVGQSSAYGVIPKRLQPVFRDRDELSSASDLSAKVRQALGESGALVVICSPVSAASRWVNEEIREFRQQGRGNRIFAVIVDGDPEEGAAESCFPPALLEAEDGTKVEPLAADAREWADGRLLSLLKLLSGILDIPLDSLRRRDLQRRQRKWALSTAAVLAVAVVIMLAITFRISAQKSQAAAEARRASAEQLVVFKLREVDGLIEAPIDGVELARLERWSDASIEQLWEESGAVERGVFAASLDLREEGIARWRQGHSAEATEFFEKSWILIADQYRQSRDPELLFELGQAEYWLGQMAMDEGDFTEAERSFLVYADISRKLLRAVPENAEWVLEMAYALSNLGGLQTQRQKADQLMARRFLQAALQFNQIALVLDPDNTDYRRELEQSHAYLADAHVRVCDLGPALDSRLEGTRLAREFVQNAPDDERARRFLAFSLGGLAGVQLSLGMVEQAAASLRESLDIAGGLAAVDPGGIHLKWLLLERRSRLLAVTSLNEPGSEAVQQALELDRAWQQLLRGGQSLPMDIGWGYGDFLLTRERIARETGDGAMADGLLEQALQYFGEQVAASPHIGQQGRILLQTVFRYFRRKGVLPQDEYLNAVEELSLDRSPTPSCNELRLAAMRAMLLGQPDAAKRYTSDLLGKGYLDPEFINFCREYDLCPGE